MIPHCYLLLEDVDKCFQWRILRSLFAKNGLERCFLKINNNILVNPYCASTSQHSFLEYVLLKDVGFKSL
jgi:hypothetical protein